MNENSFSAALGRDLRKAGASLAWKISDRFAGGTPDMFIEGNACDLWIENKWLNPVPKRPTTMIDLCHPDKFLSYNQQDWLIRRHQNRGDSAVILAGEPGCVYFPGLSWQTPISTGEFLERAIPRKKLIQLILQVID